MHLWAHILLALGFQELVELREAKQLLIQQKLELQGKVETAQGALEQEKKEHQLTKDRRSQREETLLSQTKALQDQLVGSYINNTNIIYIYCMSLMGM